MKRWRLPVRVPPHLRVLFRGAFLLLMAATLGLALSVLQDEKERGARLYTDSLKKTESQIAARLRHPAGQLALLNPTVATRRVQSVHPLLLPFAALDFDDRYKARQAVEMAGCGLQYPGGATLCAAVGANPYAGGFVYLVASLAAGELTAHDRGDLELTDVHRVRVDVDYRGSHSRWIAPYERSRDGRGRLTGYAGDAPLAEGVRPLRDFRGWLWQEGRCIDPSEEAPGCARRTFISIRLPVTVFQDALAARDPHWPPPDLDKMAVRLRLLAPGSAAPVFDSDAAGATMPFSLAELGDLLRPGEHLTVRRAGAASPLFTLEGSDPGDERVAPWVAWLIRELPAHGLPSPLSERALVDTSLGRFELELSGDLRSVNRSLAAVVTRLAWTVGTMLFAIGAVWGALELLVIRRITLLTSRAAAVSTGMRSAPEGARLSDLDLSDLGGRDELGVLAQGLKDLLHRVNEDMRREQIRTAQEKDLWHAVGHEIMAPLQSLMALHGGKGDPSERYIARMQQAVRVLYGQASPSEAFEATRVAMQAMDLDAFLGHVAENARYIGIDGVQYVPHGRPLLVRADEHCLEDVVTHVLRNAQRHRKAGTQIRLRVEADSQSVRATLHNEGAPIADGMLDRIFEYGVSETAGAADEENGANAPSTAAQRGQGLFVARTYMAKMGGTIFARNCDDGVEFTLSLPRIA
ncbi:MAG: HAMP domain-containing histidine kinase [Burkholderiaceae bacterium]|nr:HAMP domain-containing histidine kinase [Burkholderiaceae bacterium]